MSFFFFFFSLDKYGQISFSNFILFFVVSVGEGSVHSRSTFFKFNIFKLAT